MEEPRAPLASRNDRDSWRKEVAGPSGVNLVAGIWLVASAFVLRDPADQPIWNPIVFGSILAALALLRVAGAYRHSWISGINVTIGAWIFAAAFWLAPSEAAAWNDLIVGAVVMAFGIWSMSASEEGRLREGRRRRGSGNYHPPPTGVG